MDKVKHYLFLFIHFIYKFNVNIKSHKHHLIVKIPAGRIGLPGPVQGFEIWYIWSAPSREVPY